jgi:hypothetical protein
MVLGTSPPHYVTGYCNTQFNLCTYRKWVIFFGAGRVLGYEQGGDY